MKVIPFQQLLLILVPSTAVLVIIAYAHLFLHVEIPLLTRDVTATAELHPLAGALSNLGLLLWCVTAAVCLFAAMLLYRIKERDSFLFLIFSSLLSAYLLFDDLFLFHEVLGPQYVGINEKIIFVLLAVAVAVYLLVYRNIILQTRFIILLLALGFLSTSVLIDTVLGNLITQSGDWQFFIEDGAKWLGIACWCGYYVQASYQVLINALLP
ncbi:MAG: hypothetical protein WBH20_03670 [Oceanisphaera sp.]|uniref:hypothetical protein n=1 Tax=Oceanisphaera sp. TaxID=1929979 RepID=UPI003C739867